MNLSSAFRIQPHDVVAFVGAGGKTTAMFRLAEELVTQGKRVVVTTTTKLAASQADDLTSHPQILRLRSAPLRMTTADHRLLTIPRHSLLTLLMHARATR